MEPAPGQRQNRWILIPSFPGSNPGAPATQSDLPLTFLRYPENRAVARYFAGEELSDPEAILYRDATFLAGDILWQRY